jgi:hypothetical protein
MCPLSIGRVSGQATIETARRRFYMRKGPVLNINACMVEVDLNQLAVRSPVHARRCASLIVNRIFSRMDRISGEKEAIYSSMLSG